MNHSNPKALDFLRTRRSHPPSTLRAPGPDAAALEDLLTIAARTPDHGKLEPWRFIVLRDDSLDRLAPLVEAASAAAGNPAEKAAKHGSSFRVPVVVAVVFAPVESANIPEWEQFLSAGAVCLGLVNASLAAGFGASWLSGVASEPSFAQQHLGIAPNERIAGFIHIGSRGEATPPERPRPDIAAKTSYPA
ncbi:nitroreductase [Paracoccus aurantiacus]|uniref:Putative NAD(P)H nitroreductase n=1 Tax=Paracoccus aurantiacus TaxID=2599412 RepID=A0A5C6S3R2_9RHOB|nr:nitroreductase family protein [Paracoccus aurantiacus]TXB69065.1 nitroreductase [Paracoccus aurantiacus]